MKTIEIYTNLVSEGWSANSLNTGVGGSEEKLIELARELAKEYDVTIYHNGTHGVFDGVKYKDHREFKAYAYRDVFISFKVRGIWTKSINAKRKIHWTTEIEPGFGISGLNAIDRVVTISKYHNSRMITKSPKINPSYLWIDTDRHDRFKTNKKKGLMVYTSSLDRGLEELVSNFDVVKEKLGVRKLVVTYGWNFIDKIIPFNPSVATWKERMLRLLDRNDIEFVGRLSYDEITKLFWKAQYWALPLNNPDSELFCINAIRAQYCGAIPVVRRIGALQETVNEFIDFDSLLGQKVGISQVNFKTGQNNREHAEKFNLSTAIKEWKQILELD